MDRETAKKYGIPFDKASDLVCLAKEARCIEDAEGYLYFFERREYGWHCATYEEILENYNMREMAWQKLGPDSTVEDLKSRIRPLTEGLYRFENDHCAS
jgi:hypothetical protein